MNRRARRLWHPASRASSPAATSAFTDFHEWVLSLPWVVECRYRLGTPGVRAFGVDCEPLDRRQLWLITGLHNPLHADEAALAVIVPNDAAYAIEDCGWAYRWTPEPAGHILMRASHRAVHRPEEIEGLALAAYSLAMA